MRWPDLRALAARRGAGDAPAERLVVDTLGGRMHVRWDEGTAATGVFERWVSSGPLTYRSGNTSDKRDVLGTLMLEPLVAQQFSRQDGSQRIRGGIARERRIDGKQLRLELAGPSHAAPHAAARPGRRPEAADRQHRRAALQHVKAAAEQFTTIDSWGCMPRHISDRIASVIGPLKPPPALQATD